MGCSSMHVLYSWGLLPVAHPQLAQLPSLRLSFWLFPLEFIVLGLLIYAIG